VLPFGAVSVNVTLAPEAGAPPLTADAVIATVPGRVMLDAETEMLTASDCGVMTVAFAADDPVNALVDAFKFTA
jgi:hypothetical protein